MSADRKETGQGQQAPEERHTDKKLSFWQTMGSVIAASFGVQSQKNKERDFEKGSISGFIAAALIFTFVFVVTLVVVVRLVLP